MKFAFCLIKYFPFGGLQRDFKQIADVCLLRGHQVDAYVTSWQGAAREGLNIFVTRAPGFTNHARRDSFGRALIQRFSRKNYDVVVGFNKLPGLNVYYAADPCYAAKSDEKSILYRLTGRYRSNIRVEKTVFDRSSKTEILLLSKTEKAIFMQYYKTPEHRFHLLPPGISSDRLAPRDRKKNCDALRRELGIPMDTNVVLFVGSGFRTKGLDRVIRAISALPDALRDNTIVLIVGQDNARPFRRLARQLRVAKHVRFMKGRDDIVRFYLAADLLLHPALRENTGAVLLEAMAAGLPVLATDVCGYSEHINLANAGELVPSPFRQDTLNTLLQSMLTSDKKAQWRTNGTQYAANNDFSSLPEKAADIIEQVSAC